MSYQKNYGELSANFLAIIIKQKIRINCIEEINIKSDEKNIKYYHMP